MAAEVKKEIQLEIAHVLFIDIVEYSKLTNEQQSDVSRAVNHIVRETEQFRVADLSGKLIRIPTGDGMALVFSDNVQAAANCAVQISEAAREDPRIRLRMGIHSGPVTKADDINDRSNITGAGINVAQRVMDCGDAGHILLSRRAADDLAPLQRWHPHLHEIGEAEVKHGVRIPLVNFFTETAGNPDLPNKLKRETRERAATVSRRRKKLLAAIGSVLAVAALASLFLLRVSVKKLEKSIAVLPFANLSAEKENAYFAGGIQDQILTNLAKIGDLKVISRTSVTAYASNQPNVREIAKVLGVAAVVEGSVQRVANRVRISVQLINAATDEHIWAENYERDLTDVFAAQRDIAFEIASSLHAQLSPNEKARLQRRPTSSGAAYLVYLQAQDALSRSQSVEEIEKVAPLYEKAIELDPAFALAFARLSHVEAMIYYSRQTPRILEQARAAANEALRLQPDLPEAHLALGYIHFWGEHDYGRALTEFDLAQAGLPNDADVVAAIAAIQRRQGKWSESTANYQKAAVLNPKDTAIWGMGLAANYTSLRDYSAAAKALDRAIAADPSFFHNHNWRAQLDIDLKGDMRAMEQLLAKTPENVDPDGVVTYSRYELALFQRKYDEAIAVLDRSAAETVEITHAAAGGDCPRSFLRGLAYWLKKDSANSHRSFEEARAVLERRVQESPTVGAMHALLGQIYAGLGRKEDAVREAKRAIELSPESQDRFHGPRLTITVSRIYSLLGDTDSALPLLEHLLYAPGGLTPFLLRLDPIWDPLRGDPRFQNLVAPPAPK
jgi:TolB-like protein/Tfp pilus assembly protein PilF